MDVDAAGGAITGGIVGGALEKPGGKAGEPHSGSCTDCGQAVGGNFCAHCGQPTHVHRTLLHLGEELLHGVMHFDGRIWRTLPLLTLNPGRLTREWVQGKRSRYVSPLGLFLFTIFLMFFILSFGGGAPIKVAPLDERLSSTRLELIEEQQAVALAQKRHDEAQRAASTAKPQDAEIAKAELVESKSDLDAAASNLAATRNRVAKLETAKASGPRSDGYEPGSWQAEIHDSVINNKAEVNTGSESLNKKVLKKLSNPDFALYKIQQTLYKFSFLLIPISIPFVALLFIWKREFTLYDHGVFVLYSLTFMAILGMALSFLGRIEWLEGFATLIMVVAPPVHMFAQMKGAYSLSIGSALWRTILLLHFCCIALALFLLAIILLGLGG